MGFCAHTMPWDMDADQHVTKTWGNDLHTEVKQVRSDPGRESKLSSKTDRDPRVQSVDTKLDQQAPP